MNYISCLNYKRCEKIYDVYEKINLRSERNFATSLSRITIISLLFINIVPMHAMADADSDFAVRCSEPGVIFCVGFDSQEEINNIGQTRYPALSGEGSIVENPVAYPNNISPDGWRYPAFDSSQKASGAGSLRLTANQVAVANQSGGWYLGEAGKTPWPKTFGAGETIYLQWRQRYDRAYTNEIDWKSVGGDGVKQIILWRNEGSCSDLQYTVVDSASRGYPQAYTNCGGNPLYYCPTGNNCPEWKTNYLSTNHVQYLYQQGPVETADFRCMRNHETEDTCGFWKDHNDTWWTYYVEINIGDPNVKNSHIKSWLSRGNGEALRQFIDFGPFPWDYVEGRELQNILLTLYKTSKNSTDHAIATVWYDELIISSNPIPVPESVKLSMENRSTNPPESTLLIVE